MPGFRGSPTQSRKNLNFLLISDELRGGIALGRSLHFKSCKIWNFEECLDCRERCAVFDMSPFSKVKVKGKDALKFLQWVCSSDINKPVGSITYGLMCNGKVS